jgi:hypothetical protein
MWSYPKNCSSLMSITGARRRTKGGISTKVNGLLTGSHLPVTALCHQSLVPHPRVQSLRMMLLMNGVLMAEPPHRLQRKNGPEANALPSTSMVNVGTMEWQAI